VFKNDAGFEKRSVVSQGERVLALACALTSTQCSTREVFGASSVEISWWVAPSPTACML
jgi:hypothetical protein